MKILAYTETYASETVTFITNELSVLEKKHHLLLIYSTRKNPTRYILKNMLCLPYNFNRVINKLRWWLEQSQVYFTTFNIPFKKKLNQAINDFKPEIIHCHFGTDFLKVAQNLDNIHKNIPTLISFYGYDVTERIKNRAVLKQYRKYLSNPNVFSVAVSHSLADNINNFIKPFNKAGLLHSGVDTDFFRRKNIATSPGDFTFLQVASFNPKKGHLYMLEAFKIFLDKTHNKKYRLIIAGFGPLESEIKNRIIELQLTDNVTVLPAQTPAEMVELCSRVNCFVHMSVTADNGDQEGLPNVLLEAMSLELPILSTVHAGIPEIVEHKKNGILCAEKNIEEYVQGFEEISKWKLCPHNREKIITQFSLQAHMQKLEDIYMKIQKTNAA